MDGVLRYNTHRCCSNSLHLTTIDSQEHSRKLFCHGDYFAEHCFVTLAEDSVFCDYIEVLEWRSGRVSLKDSRCRHLDNFVHAVLEQNIERKLSVAAKSRSAKLLKTHRDAFVSANHETLPACKGLPCFLGGRSGFRFVWMLFLDDKWVDCYFG
jgi:hypothetical protein